MRRAAGVAWLALALGACASRGGRVSVDLTPARESLEAAREAGAPEKAPDSFQAARDSLEHAEQLAPQGDAAAREAALRAEWSARLALSEARCAARLTEASAAGDKEPAPEADALRARLRRNDEEQRRLEEQLALQRRELEVTETELIRTKARLKGIETKAEASSAIAEARILMRRLDSRRSSAVLSLCKESVAKAEQQIQDDNYGAALFFALKAQSLALKAQEPTAQAAPPAPAESADQAPPQESYVVKASSANIRQGPSTGDAVVGRAPHGARVEASALRGSWVKVRYGSLDGWIALSLLE